MMDFVDVYGRTIAVAVDQDGEDVYTLSGITVGFPTGTPQAQAVATIEGMAPAGYVAPQVNWTFLQFWALFTSAEQVAIFTARKTDVQTDMFITMAAGAGQLQLTNPEVVAGVGYLVSTNVLTSARATAVLVGQAPT